MRLFLHREGLYLLSELSQVLVSAEGHSHDVVVAGCYSQLMKPRSKA